MILAMWRVWISRGTRGAKILDLGAEQPTAAELFWYPNLFWYIPTGNWLVEASIASILPLMWWGLLPALP